MQNNKDDIWKTHIPLEYTLLLVLYFFQVELDKSITILKDKEQELEKAIERLSEQQPIDVDEAVTTTAPLYKQ
jgi:ESCRT-I complex subunit TSG101